MNASSERLISINYGGPLSIGQKCSNTVLLNGSIFLPHTSGGPPSSGTNTKRNSSHNSLSVGAEEQEYRRASGTVVRFATIDSQSGDEDEEASIDSSTPASSEIGKTTNNNEEPEINRRVSDTTQNIGNYMQNSFGAMEDGRMEGDVFM